DAADAARARRSGDVERTVAAGGELLDRLRRRHDEVVARRPLLEPISIAWVLLSEAEATRLERRPSPDAWVASADAWHQLHRPYAEAYARWREAEARLAARGDRRDAARALRDALQTAEDLRAEPLVREIRALAGRARLSLATEEPPAVPAPDDATA